MATVASGITFTVSHSVTNVVLNDAFANATVTGIVNADISSSAGISPSKIDFSGGYTALSGGITVGGGSATDIGYIRAGTATLSSGTVTVNDSAVTANSIIMVTPQANPTGRVYEDQASRVASTSFTIKSSSSESLVVGYLLIAI